MHFVQGTKRDTGKKLRWDKKKKLREEELKNMEIKSS